MSTSQPKKLPGETRDTIKTQVETMIEDTVATAVLETANARKAPVKLVTGDDRQYIDESIRTPSPGPNQSQVSIVLDQETVAVTIAVQKWDLPPVTGGEEPFIPADTVLADHGDAFKEFGETVAAAVADELSVKHNDIDDAVVGDKKVTFVCDGTVGPGFSPTTLVRYVCIFDAAAFEVLDSVWDGDT